MKYKILDNIAWIILTFIGIIYLIIGAALYMSNNVSLDNIKETTAIITSIKEIEEDEYEVGIIYNIDGTIYKNNLNSYSSSYYEGKEITIYYDKTNPYQIVDTTTNIIAFIFGGVGLLLLIIAIIIIAFKIRKKKLIVTLKETGYVANAKYLRTSINALFTVNGKHPYKIVCELNNALDGKLHIVESKNIWFDPEPIIKEQNIKTFRVYYNPNNLKQYYVDIEMFLENNK